MTRIHTGVDDVSGNTQASLTTRDIAIEWQSSLIDAIEAPRSSSNWRRRWHSRCNCTRRCRCRAVTDRICCHHSNGVQSSVGEASNNATKLGGSCTCTATRSSSCFKHGDWRIAIAQRSGPRHNKCTICGRGRCITRGTWQCRRKCSNETPVQRRSTATSVPSVNSNFVFSSFNDISHNLAPQNGGVWHVIIHS